jgi:hypothetical protein
MKFSRQYTKLQDRLFTTIRADDYYEEGQIIPIQTPMQSFNARVLLKFMMTFDEIPEAFLQYDTDSPELSAEQIRDLIRDLYHRDPPGDHSGMTIYLLEKV